VIYEIVIMILAAVVGLGSTALADLYKDLGAQGYRWVSFDDPYDCQSKDDLREISKDQSNLLDPQIPPITQILLEITSGRRFAT
jgi:hypothetical protein